MAAWLGTGHQPQGCLPGLGKVLMKWVSTSSALPGGHIPGECCSPSLAPPVGCFRLELAEQFSWWHSEGTISPGSSVWDAWS